MTEFIYDCWNGVMNHNKNPLKHIPDLQVRHLVLQILGCGVLYFPCMLEVGL